jgi:Protein of unknown function (DUF4054)
MTLSEFRLMFPEFRTAQDTFIQAFLDDAATMVSETSCGSRYSLLHGLKAAHLIATSPAGVAAKMVSKDGTTTYGTQFREVAMSKVAGIMVA